MVLSTDGDAYVKGIVCLFKVSEQKKETSSTLGMRRSVETSELLKVLFLEYLSWKNEVYP